MVEAATAVDRPRVRVLRLHNLVEVECCGDPQTQGSPYGPTLGYGSESRWDSKLHPNSYNLRMISFGIAIYISLIWARVEVKIADGKPGLTNPPRSRSRGDMASAILVISVSRNFFCLS
jgi:hypothetical protein